MKKIARKFVPTAKRRWRRPVRKPTGVFARPQHQSPSLVLRDESRFTLPSVYLTGDAHGKMRALIEACPIEVSWLATCSEEKEGEIVIDNIFVPHQVCSPGSTTIRGDGEAKLLTELYGKGLTADINRLDCWGHSHVKMPVFASGTDEEQTADFLRRSAEMRKPFFVRLIANKYDDLFASVYLLDEGLDIHHVPIHAEPAQTGRWRKWARSQIRLKVTRMRIQNVHPVGFDTQVFDPYDPWGYFSSFLPLKKATITVLPSTDLP